MPDTTFSEQLLEKLAAVFETDKAQEFINKANSQSDIGLVSRVFNDLGLNMPPHELQALLDAKEKGWPTFTKVICQQVEPIINQLFYGDKPTQFDTLYETHFKDSGFTREAIKSKLVSGIIVQHAECATAVMSEKILVPNLLMDTISAINEVAQLIQTPEDVTLSAHSTLSNPGPIKDHLGKLQKTNQKKSTMLVAQEISIFVSTIELHETLLRGIKRAVDSKRLIDLLRELNEVILRNPIDPEVASLEESLPKFLHDLLEVKTTIEELPNGRDSTLKSSKKGILSSIKELEEVLKTQVTRLEKAALQIIDIKLGMNFSEVIQTLDTQLAALKKLTQENEAFLSESGVLANNTQTAIGTITEIRRTLLEEANSISADNTIETIPALREKIAILNQVLQQTADDISAKTGGSVQQAILNILEPVLKAVGDFMAWCGYVSKGVAKRRVKEHLQNQLKASESLEESLSKVSLTDKNSPAVLTNPPNNASRNLAADFQRAMANEELFVNEKALSEYAAKYNGFEEKSDVLRFFKEVLLQNVRGNKTQMVQYLEEKFHQNGLLFPVTSSVQTAMIEYNAQTGAPYRLDTLRSGTLTKKVALETNSTGFTVKEQMKVGSLIVCDNLYEKGKKNPLYELSEDRTTLSAEIEGSPILAAQGTVQVDFSQNPAEPTLTALENTITYGHRALAEKMETLRENRPGSDAVSDGDFTDGELSSEGGAETDDEGTYEDAQDPAEKSAHSYNNLPADVKREIGKKMLELEEKRKKLKSSHPNEPETDDEDDEEYYDTNPPPGP